MADDSRYNEDQLARLERELAALVRQFRRAAAAGDLAAEGVEAEAICERIKWLLYHHLDLRVGMGSDDWIWLQGPGDDYRVEQVDPLQLQASGRLWCSLPEGGFREWT